MVSRGADVLFTARVYRRTSRGTDQFYSGLVDVVPVSVFVDHFLLNQPFHPHSNLYLYNGKKGDTGARLEGSHSRKDVIPHAYIQQIGTGQDSAYYHIQW